MLYKSFKSLLDLAEQQGKKLDTFADFFEFAKTLNSNEIVIKKG